MIILILAIISAFILFNSKKLKFSKIIIKIFKNNSNIKSFIINPILDKNILQENGFRVVVIKNNNNFTIKITIVEIINNQTYTSYFEKTYFHFNNQIKEIINNKYSFELIAL